MKRLKRWLVAPPVLLYANSWSMPIYYALPGWIIPVDHQDGLFPSFVSSWIIHIYCFCGIISIHYWAGFFPIQWLPHYFWLDSINLKMKPCWLQIGCFNTINRYFSRVNNFQVYQWIVLAGGGVGGSKMLWQTLQIVTHSNPVTRFGLWHVTALVIPTQTVTHQISECQRTCANQPSVFGSPQESFHLFYSYFGLCPPGWCILPFITHPHWGNPY